MLRPSQLTWVRRRRLFGLIPLVIGLAMVASGCDKLTGGGWIQSASLVLGQKASFSFVAHCSNTTVDGVPAAEFYDGEFEFSDQSFNPLVKIHGDVQPWVFGTELGVTCSEFKKTDLNLFTAMGFQGVYRTQTTPSGQGNFVVEISDGGEPASIDGDTITVSLDGAVDYFNVGVVQGGDIQIH
jgi:hypothetical protein